MLLQGKTAVITGCLRGIGRDAMGLFARHGCNVLACCQYEDPEFESACRNLAGETGVAVTPLYFDLRYSDQIKAAVKQIMNARQRVDILLNVAGMTEDSLFHMTSMESMKTVFEVNFFSQMLLTQYITKIMVRQKSGSVVFVSSMMGLDGNPGQISYAASKAALIGATKTLARELAEYNIRVNSVAPGVIETDFTKHVPEAALERICSRIPMSRTGMPTEVSRVMLYLASDLSSYVTGQVIRIDGGIG